MMRTNATSTTATEIASAVEGSAVDWTSQRADREEAERPRPPIAMSIIVATPRAELPARSTSASPSSRSDDAGHDDDLQDERERGQRRRASSTWRVAATTTASAVTTSDWKA